MNEHFCQEHQTKFYKNEKVDANGQLKVWYSHKKADGSGYCNEVNRSSNGKPSFNGNGKSYGKSPEETRAIQRQHSQHMALLYMQIKGITNFTLEDLKKTIGWFDKDLEPVITPHVQPNTEDTDLGFR